jgi:RNA polymerase sigma-70 factor (ECF subfamily)
MTFSLRWSLVLWDDDARGGVTCHAQNRYLVSADVEHDDDLRRLMFSIAYRMVGSVSEAEDIVQEAFLRMHRADAEGGAIESPKAYLSTVTTRLAIDHLRSARVRREEYVGTWLPEPVLDDPRADPAGHAETADTLSLAFLVVLESLSPVERAVFLLHDVFDYGFDEIAPIVDKSPDNCRQIAVRARRHVDERKPRFSISEDERDDVLRRVVAAFEEGDAREIVELMAGDVVLYGDGGGKAPAIPKPMHGRERVAKVVLGFTRQGIKFHVRPEPAVVNGQPGAAFRDREGRLVSVMAFELADGKIQSIRSIVNPDKLRHLGPVADIKALLREARGR